MSIFRSYLLTVILIWSCISQAIGQTYAGNGQPSPYSGDGGTASAAVLTNPTGISLDAFGNLYIAERGHIRRVDGATKQISTLVVTSTDESGNEYPYDVKLDAAGNLFWCDTAAHVVRRRDAISGIITTVAGTGAAGYDGDGGRAVEASLNLPTGFAIDKTGNLYIVDTGSHTVRRVDPNTGLIQTIAGNGTAGSNGDGGASIESTLNAPLGIAMDGAGNLYVSEMGSHRIRRIDVATGLIFSAVGSGMAGYNGDGIRASKANLRMPGLMTISESGNLVFADVLNNRVRMLDVSSGLIWTIAGGRAGALKAPAGVAISPLGSLLISESKGHVVRSQALPGPTAVTGLNLVIKSNRVPITTPLSISANITASNGLARNATGMVNFFYGPTEDGTYGQLGTAPLLSGEATLTTPLWNLGPWRINAEYLGDESFAPTATFISGESGGLDLALTVTPLLTLSVNTESPVKGEPVSLTASLMPNNQTGTIEFRDGNLVIGTSDIASGLATLTAPAPAAGLRSISAVYKADNIYTGTASESLPVKVKQSAWAQLISSRNPAGQGDSVTFHALISPALSTGSVSFYDNGILIGSSAMNLDFPGSSLFTTSFTGLGNHTISARYGGDADTGSAAAFGISQTVLSAVTISISSNPPNPTPGQNAIYSVSVNPSSATGNIQFFDNDLDIGSAPLIRGTSSIAVTNLAIGVHSVKAVYRGDTTHSGNSSAPLVQTVLKKNSQVTVTTVSNTSTVGQGVVFAVTIIPATATGSVQLLDNGTVLGTIVLRNGTGSLITTALGAGTHAMQAVYSGDALWNASGSLVIYQQVKASTSLVLKTTPNPANASETLVLQAEVQPAAASGTVQFFDGTNLLGTAIFNNGIATMSVQGLVSGVHNLKAVYAGNSTYAGSISNTLPQLLR